jgi:hypothetical protein
MTNFQHLDIPTLHAWLDGGFTDWQCRHPCRVEP